MKAQRLHIAMIVRSDVIFEGLHSIISQSDLDATICKVDSLHELEQVIHGRPVDVLIINPVLLINSEREVRRIRKQHPNLSIVGIRTGMTDHTVRAMLDNTFSLYDAADHIIGKLQKAAVDTESRSMGQTENLTEREIDVLTKLVHGLTNKEIAESLNISIHTVITHRKNIASKTGIRSQSGLTIFAISKKIVDIDDVNPFG